MLSVIVVTVAVVVVVVVDPLSSPQEGCEALCMFVKGAAASLEAHVKREAAVDDAVQDDLNGALDDFEVSCTPSLLVIAVVLVLLVAAARLPLMRVPRLRAVPSIGHACRVLFAKCAALDADDVAVVDDVCRRETPRRRRLWRRRWSMFDEHPTWTSSRNACRLRWRA
jgi:hypothetical protein